MRIARSPKSKPRVLRPRMREKPKAAIVPIGTEIPTVPRAMTTLLIRKRQNSFFTQTW